VRIEYDQTARDRLDAETTMGEGIAGLSVDNVVYIAKTGPEPRVGRSHSSQFGAEGWA